MEPDAVADLARRWLRARCRAVEIELGAPVPVTEDEEITRVRAATEVSLPALFRRVFDHGVLLGRGFRQTHDRPKTHSGSGTQELLGVHELLPRLRVECLANEFRPTESDWVLERRPCQNRDSAVCSYFREASMGLVSGLSATQALSRVSSAGIGGSACIDVLHDAADLKARYLPIPREMNDGLTAVATLVGKAGGRSPEYLGVAEGKLHYTLPENPGGPSVRSMFERAVGRRFPGLPLVEVVPRAVLDA